ncbi:hypothetical protein Tco_1530696, partial [Tanacetum coccineum]
AEMGLLDFVKSAELFKVKTMDRTLAENEVLVLTETESRVISPSSEIVYLIDHTIVDELQNATGKKKRKVAFNVDFPPVKKARAGALVISEPNPTTAGKTPTAIKKLGIHSGVFRRVLRLITEAEAAAASPVNEIGPSFIPGNETRASSSALDDGSLVDDFYESQTIHSATAHDIYVLNWDVTNNAHMDDLVMCKNFIDHVPPLGYWAYLRNCTAAEFLDRLNFAQHSFETIQQRDAKITTLRSKLEKAECEVAYLVVLCKRVSESGFEARTEREDLRDEIKGEAKMREEFMSIQDAEA